ncbi:MAG: hypothetical protein EU548_06245 [Promethearchaeota archaeon]|nr:MAG: hypothetical protein EU548_06245 [Candidatus Lokiarchaeota archaeon]
MGQIPQIRGVIRGTCSAYRPSQNFSKKRVDVTLNCASFTFPSSSITIRNPPCPSNRVIGSTFISLTIFSLPPFYRDIYAL